MQLTSKTVQLIRYIGFGLDATNLTLTCMPPMRGVTNPLPNRNFAFALAEPEAPSNATASVGSSREHSDWRISNLLIVLIIIAGANCESHHCASVAHMLIQSTQKLCVYVVASASVFKIK